MTDSSFAPPASTDDWGPVDRGDGTVSIVHQPSYEQGRQSAIDMLRRLADARDAYSHPDVQRETHAVRLVADILAGDTTAHGWLPSWKWDEFGIDDV